MSLLKIIPGWGWLALGLAVLSALAFMQYRAVTAERDALAAQLERSQAEAQALESALEWRRQHARDLEAALAKRERDIQAAQQQIRGHLEALDRLERDDEQMREYLDSPLPPAVADWLRALPAQDGDRASAGDTAGAAAPADTAAGTDAEN